MAWSSACRTPPQNPPLHGKDKLAGAAPTEGNNTPAVSRAPTPAVAPLDVSALSSIARYLKDDLKRIFKTVLDFRPPALVPALVVITAPHYEGQYKRPLKARFPDVYWGKTQIECYKFFQPCKDYFSTAGAPRLNQVPFAANFPKDTALFYWQQHQYKIEDEINVPIT